MLDFLSKTDIEKVKNKISEIENSSSGEVVISIRRKRNFFERKKSIFQLASEEFRRANVANTIDSTGVLIFILLSEKKLYILPDNNIIKVVPDNFWQNLADEMSEKFKTRKFVDGLLDCIEKIGEVMKNHFPKKQEDVNELPDDIRIN